MAARAEPGSHGSAASLVQTACAAVSPASMSRSWRADSPSMSRSCTPRWVGISCRNMEVSFLALRGDAWSSVVRQNGSGTEAGQRAADHVGDDPGRYDDDHPEQRIDHRPLAPLHLMGAASGGHVLEGADDDEEHGDAEHNAGADGDEVLEQVVDCFHCGVSLCLAGCVGSGEPGPWPAGRFCASPASGRTASPELPAGFAPASWLRLERQARTGAGASAAAPATRPAPA